MNGSPPGSALLCDLGGVVVRDALPGMVAKWAPRLGISEQALISAVFAGNDDTVLVGRMSEPEWWDVVRERLDVNEETVAEIRRDLTGNPVWDHALVDAVAALRGRVGTAFVSNAWPHTRTGLAELLAVADHAVLSYEVGVAKPDPRIYTHALELLGVPASAALFVDDSARNVAAAQALGMTGHLHTEAAGTLAAVESFTRAT
ncbi:HAD family hydrolase [Streptomyces iconiensis]|uniref:HAD family phosphatase n=1 Tax=Streptomyces iconiensis TaxID=1384038 RepID=A0ABT7A1J2_9ACTN|nr:HAD family phosphatase [Streptomyces iconiensis]MDJ1135190.1 HAD family phosphatase [Streptomyces iconiensis]